MAFRGYFEVGGGHDSNVNSATADSSVTPPLGGPIFLLPSSQEQSDRYLTFGGGIGLRGPVSRSFSVFGGVAYTNKTNIDEDDFSTSSWDLNLGLGCARAFGQDSLVVYLGAYGGQEREEDETFPQFGHDLYGALVGAQQFLGEKFSVFVNASGEIRRYGGPDLVFLIDREDDQYSASAGIHFVPRNRLRLTLQGSYTRNSSNIPINEFDRWFASLILRNDF